MRSTLWRSPPTGPPTTTPPSSGRSPTYYGVTASSPSTAVSMLPLTVLRRLDGVLEPTKERSGARLAGGDGDVGDAEPTEGVDDGGAQLAGEQRLAGDVDYDVEGHPGRCAVVGPHDYAGVGVVRARVRWVDVSRPTAPTLLAWVP